MLITAAGVVGFVSYEKSQDYTAAARQDRVDYLLASKATGVFWREREAMNEYLLAPRAAVFAEAQARRVDFDGRLASFSAGSQREGAFVARIRAANLRLFQVFHRGLAASGAPRAATILRRLNVAEAAVTTPLDQLMQLDDRQYSHREAISRQAARRALAIEVASALLALAALAWFALIAIRLVREIDRNNVQLRDADRAKDDFVSTISHELRTPITSVQGYVELLLDADGDSLTDEQRSFLATIERSSHRLLALVNDLLLVAQARAGQLVMHKTRTDLVEVARHSVESAFATASKKGIRIALEAPANAVLDGDAARLGQAIDNLVSNAIKFTQTGGAITVAVTTVGAGTELCVSDTGSGMSEQEVGRLFERFFRTESALANQIQGTGLGLAITKAIVEAHGGTIAVSSDRGVGTSFRISLPPGAPVLAGARRLVTTAPTHA